MMKEEEKKKRIEERYKNRETLKRYLEAHKQNNHTMSSSIPVYSDHSKSFILHTTSTNYQLVDHIAVPASNPQVNEQRVVIRKPNTKKIDLMSRRHVIESILFANSLKKELQKENTLAGIDRRRRLEKLAKRNKMVGPGYYEVAYSQIDKKISDGMVHKSIQKPIFETSSGSVIGPGIHTY